MESLLNQEPETKSKKKKKPSKPREPKEKKEKKEKSPRKRKKKGEEVKAETDPLPELTLDDGLDFPKPEISMLDGDTPNLTAALGDSNDDTVCSTPISAGTPVPATPHAELLGSTLPSDDAALPSTLPSILQDVESEPVATEGSEPGSAEKKSPKKRERKKKEPKEPKTPKEPKAKKEKKPKGEPKTPKTPKKKKKKEGETEEEKEKSAEDQPVEPKPEAEEGEETVDKEPPKPKKTKTLARPRYGNRKKK